MRILLFITIAFFSSTIAAFPSTGKNPMGPPTMGQPTYPNSGPLRSRSDDMTGSDMSNSTLMGSDIDPRVPSRNPAQKKQEQQNEIKAGPYKDGKYQFWDNEGEKKK